MIEMRNVLILLGVCSLGSCNGSTVNISPCIEDFCLAESMSEFTNSIPSTHSDFETKTTALYTEVKFKKPIEINGAEFELSFSEIDGSEQTDSTSMLFVKEMKSKTEEQCETEFVDTVNYMALKFGPLKPLKGLVPQDYKVDKKRTSKQQGYRRIESPRGQITFQASADDEALPFGLTVLGPVFTRHRDILDCKLLVMFQSK